MADKFIYFVLTILLVVYSRSIETYYLNDDLGTNLPDRFGDPIEENWQDKRSAVNEYSSSSKKHDHFPDIDVESTDLDYRNGNAEIQVDDEVEQSDTLQKRESEMDSSSVDEPLNEADIKQILSQFSRSDREALDSLMNDDSPNIDVDKRQLLKQNFENNYHLNKRNNYNVHCEGLNCEESDRMPMSNELISEDDSYNRCPEKVNAKRKPKFKRSNKFHSTSRENILQAKISLLKDNYKRSSEMRSLEDSAKRRYSKKKRKQDNDRQRIR